jgi:hypothetical protein
MSGSDDRKSGKVRTEAEIRAERLAKTLRDNLQRRKQQARARRAGAADEGSGLLAGPEQGAGLAGRVIPAPGYGLSMGPVGVDGSGPGVQGPPSADGSEPGAQGPAGSVSDGADSSAAKKDESGG